MSRHPAGRRRAPGRSNSTIFSRSAQAFVMAAFLKVAQLAGSHSSEFCLRPKSWWDILMVPTSADTPCGAGFVKFGVKNIVV